MKPDSLGFTFFDLLGYVLPGIVVLLGISVLDTTMMSGNSLALSKLTEFWPLTVIVAYFLGHVAHSLGRTLKGKLYRKLLSTKRYRSKVLREPVKKALQKDYPDVVLEGKEVRQVDRFMLADIYVDIRGGTQNRHVFEALVSFHKASMVAFSFLSLIMVLTLFWGGAVFSVEPGTTMPAGYLRTIFISALSMGMFLSFMFGFRYFNALKNDHVYAAYLTMRNRETGLKEKEPISTAGRHTHPVP
jgi:hypothetical protein